MILLLLFSVFAITITVYPIRHSKIYSIIIGLIASLCSVIGYFLWGAWPELQAHIFEEKKQEQVQALLKKIRSPAELINRLQAKVNREPQKAEGWYLLGRLYASQQEWDKAQESFKTAHQLNPDDEKITLNYIQSIWQVKRHFNSMAQKLLDTILRKDPEQIDALSMLAMNAIAQKNYKQAIGYWERVLVQLDVNSEEAVVIRKAIVKAEKNLTSKAGQDDMSRRSR